MEKEREGGSMGTPTKSEKVKERYMIWRERKWLAEVGKDRCGKDLVTQQEKSGVMSIKGGVSSTERLPCECQQNRDLWWKNVPGHQKVLFFLFAHFPTPSLSFTFPLPRTQTHKHTQSAAAPSSPRCAR